MSNTPPHCFDARQSNVIEYGNMTGPLDTDGHTMAVAFDITQVTSKTNRSNPKPGDPCHPLAAGARPPAIAGMSVRRLTPRECERLQGFPDDYTLIPYRGKPAADGPRYKALGNSMAVPVMRWIGERIQKVAAISSPAQGESK
jgi:DNA (cytosine-5)-methyltransferase 1